MSALTDHLEGLIEHRDRLEHLSISDLFDVDPNRFDRFSARLGTLLLDYSKNRLDSEALDHLLQMGRESGLEAMRDAMFAGEIVNVTESRAALHTALRNDGSPVLLAGEDVVPEILSTRQRMEAFAAAVRSGAYQVTGGSVTNVVNIGIGGSDLGPKLVVDALKPYHDGPRVHFVSNLDGADITDTLEKLDPATTLFIVASKSFTTAETMVNAGTARWWLNSALGDDVGHHFAAISTNLRAAAEFGISEERTFGFGDWVCGRFSVWSAIGLATMIAMGGENFSAFLAGAGEADRHFREAPLEKNLPVLMALIGIWHRNVCGFGSQAVIPYDNRMANFPRWMQQLDMESNGKSLAVNGEPVSLDTAPVIFGEPGTNGQHSFFQLLHQGTEIIPCDFLVAANGHNNERASQHQLLVANCLAQSEALMRGRTLAEADGQPHRVFEGNRPSNTLLYDRLDPHTLGLLMAVYEHRTVVQGFIWGINSFDQWGVELGKKLAGAISEVIESLDTDSLTNPSTRGLASDYLSKRR